MDDAHDIITLVGAGASGNELLEALLRVPGIEVRHVAGGDLDELAADAGVDLIVETGGDPEALAALTADTRLAARVLDAAGTRLLIRLIESERETVDGLERRVAAGEQRIAELTETVAQVPVEKACYVRQASHQIKSPISSIQSYVNVLLGGYAGELPDKVRDIVEKIHSRCDAALGALAKSRALADLRCAGPGGLVMTDVSLSELVGQAVERHAQLAARRGIEIHLEPCAGPDLVRCEPTTLAMLLAELVENAVIYSADGGQVDIAVTTRDDGRPAVVIGDRGIGIPERCLARVFDEDFRADTGKKHHPDGAGLGLTIAREIADLHDAHIAVRSDEGRGSTFTVTVPPAPVT